MMWLHLPSTCCPCSPVSEDSTSPSDSLCQRLASSAMWRGKSQPPKSWRRVLRTARLTTRLSGLTCEHSTADRGVASWISSLAGSRARISPAPGREPGSPDNGAACGTSSTASFARWDRASSSWRTCELCLDGDSTPFSGDWPNSGTMRNGACCPREPLAHRIAGSGCSSSGGWPTPRSSPNENRTTKVAPSHGKTHGSTLAGEACEFWLTPTTRDHKDGACADADVPTNALLGRAACRCSLPAPPPAGSGGGYSQTIQTSRLRLNPLFVEWAMGWPLGWTDFVPVETASWLSRARRHLSCLLGGQG